MRHLPYPVVSPPQKTEEAIRWGRQIQHARRDLLWGQRDLADRASVGFVTVSFIESGYMIHSGALERIARTLGLELDE